MLPSTPPASLLFLSPPSSPLLLSPSESDAKPPFSQFCGGKLHNSEDFEAFVPDSLPVFDVVALAITEAVDCAVGARDVPNCDSLADSRDSDHSSKSRAKRKRDDEYSRDNSTSIGEISESKCEYWGDNGGDGERLGSIKPDAGSLKLAALGSNRNDCDVAVANPTISSTTIAMDYTATSTTTSTTITVTPGTTDTAESLHSPEIQSESLVVISAATKLTKEAACQTDDLPAPGPPSPPVQDLAQAPTPTPTPSPVETSPSSLLLSSALPLPQTELKVERIPTGLDLILHDVSKDYFFDGSTRDSVESEFGNVPSDKDEQKKLRHLQKQQQPKDAPVISPKRALAVVMQAFTAPTTANTCLEKDAVLGSLLEFAALESAAYAKQCIDHAIVSRLAIIAGANTQDDTIGKRGFPNYHEYRKLVGVRISLYYIYIYINILCFGKKKQNDYRFFFLLSPPPR